MYASRARGDGASRHDVSALHPSGAAKWPLLLLNLQSDATKMQPKFHARPDQHVWRGYGNVDCLNDRDWWGDSCNAKVSKQHAHWQDQDWISAVSICEALCTMLLLLSEPDHAGSDLTDCTP